MLWDRTDRVHTAHRLICLFLILSSFFYFCFDGPLSQFGIFNNIPLLDGLFSVFSRPYLIHDLLSTNLSVYPTLIEMDRMISNLNKRSSLILFEDADLNFAFAVFLLIFVIGGGCNMAASWLTKRRICGFSSVVAASLIYYEQTTIYRPFVKSHLFGVVGRPVKAASAYWTHLVLMVITCPGGDWFPCAVTWLLAGWVGSIFGKYQVDNQMWWGNFLGLF
jgi:hypothetical protein